MSSPSEIKLSSSWTNFALYAGLVLILLAGFMLKSMLSDGVMTGGRIFALILITGICGFNIYLFIYTCNARIVGDKLVMKKQFRPTKSYNFDKIGIPSSFTIKSTKYITVHMENDDGSEEKYIIINSSSILSFEDRDAEDMLNRLREAVQG